MKPEDIERIAPGLGRLMPEVGDRTWKAYYAAQAGNWPLAVVGVVASVVAAYFYLRVIVYMYMREPAEGIESDDGVMPRVAAGVLAAGIVVLGVFPGILTGILEPASIVRW